MHDVTLCLLIHAQLDCLFGVLFVGNDTVVTFILSRDGMLETFFLDLG